MEAFLSKEVLEGMKSARRKEERKTNRLRVHAGDDVFPVLKLWDGGFSVSADDVPQLRGLVDLYMGINHLSQCLIIRAEQVGDTVNYEFKRRTDAVDSAALDYEVDVNAPIALLR